MQEANVYIKKIRQEFPISAIFHLFAAEFLSLIIRKNLNIKGFKTYQLDKEVKNIFDTDDMILTLINIDLANKSFETIRNF